MLFLFLTNIEIIQVCILHVKIYCKKYSFKIRNVGIKKFLFYIFRSDSAFKGSTIAVCFLLLISYLLTCLCLFKKCGELYMMRHPDQFRQKIKVSDEEIGELHDTDMLETSIIEPPRETVRIRNIDTVSYSIAQNASLPDVDETGQIIWN